MRAKLVVGNWKMNGALASNARLLARLVEGARHVARPMAVCVPFPYLAQAQAALSGSPVAWGAQDVSAHAAGAHTGEVAATMLKDVGCSHVIIGHSERRQFYGDTDGAVNLKTKSAISAGLTAIVCVGELLSQRETGDAEFVVKDQLTTGLAGLTLADTERIIIAYEPVWAIGTGKTATPEQAQDMHGAIRKVLAEMHGDPAANAIRILYGGSVKPDNISQLMKQADIDGALVGGASLEAESFASIVNYERS